METLEHLELLDKSNLNIVLSNNDKQLLEINDKQTNLISHYQRVITDIIKNLHEKEFCFSVKLYSNLKGFYIYFNNGIEVTLSLNESLKLHVNYNKELTRDTFIVGEVIGRLCTVINTENNIVVNLLNEMSVKNTENCNAINQTLTVSEFIKNVLYKKRHDVLDSVVDEYFDNLLNTHKTFISYSNLICIGGRSANAIRLTKTISDKTSIELIDYSNDIETVVLRQSIKTATLHERLKPLINRTLVILHLLDNIGENSNFMYCSKIPFLKLYSECVIKVKYIGLKTNPMVSLIVDDKVSNPIKFSVFVDELYNKRQYID